MYKRPIRKPNAELNTKKRIRPKIKKSRKKAILKKRRMLFYRRCALVIACLLFLFSIFGGTFLLLSKIFSIKSILVSGSNAYTEQEIISAGELRTGESFIFFSTKNAENKIYKSLVNIDSIKISKKFPNKIRVEVEDACPKYWLKEDTWKKMLNAMIQKATEKINADKPHSKQE